ncbi:MAG TPA: MFS transporter [Candidatus Baltobacteraceae bacterium]|nr:MFS transporter [Candidatus Baltobacteraceae bacterium]
MNAAAWKTFIASFLGWTLDAFDFFLVIVVVPHLATDFKRSIVDITFAVTLTLALRPVGALIFGWFADRYGRRVPLMIDIALYSLIELLTAFSPNFAVFLVLRAIFGIAMGGEWGLGAALAMESLPAKRRGLFSGLLQEGYAVGNLLAGLAFWLLFDRIGWRGMFIVGALPAFLIFFIRMQVPESPVWQARAHERLAVQGDILLAALRRYWPLFLYGMFFMAALNFMSHGTQDPYATFLTKQHGFTPATVGYINSIAAIGAILGGITFGALSQRVGRRACIILCAVLGALAVPLWAFSSTIGTLALGGFVMQFMVQGAWGIIPAHLNEIAPPLARGTFPGFVYQLGNLIASGTFQIIATLAATRFMLPNGGADYSRAMATFVVLAFAAVIVMTFIGYAVRGENRTVSMAEAA